MKNTRVQFINKFSDSSCLRVTFIVTNIVKAASPNNSRCGINYTT